MARESVLLPPARELHHGLWLQSSCPAPARLRTCQDKHSPGQSLVVVFNLWEVPGEVLEQYSSSWIKKALLCSPGLNFLSGSLHYE